MKQRWKITLGIIAGLLVVITITWMSPIGHFILTGGLGVEERPFEANEWKSVRSSEPSKKRVRMLMLDDLTDNKLKTGMDSLTVKEMLGEPDRTYGFSYDLGELAPGIDPIHLILTFDTNGKFEKLNVESEKSLEKRTVKIKVGD
ncbi:MAG: hypothetical protein JNJ75_17605 [Cyclobacteriaceae bacterium]|nr:hypothetical protein [Cyclobacteriaceae bacterium]